jgi:hypothetical protein
MGMIKDGPNQYFKSELIDHEWQMAKTNHQNHTEKE